jgi:hypothetical protein
MPVGDTMDYVGGVPIESLVNSPQIARDRVMALLFSLLVREVFEFRLVQTDPNFANYQYDAESQRLILLDFGATRPYKATMARDYRRLIKGAMAGDRALMSDACLAIGYFDATTQDKHKEAVLDIGEQALEPFCAKDGYDFGGSDLPERIRASGISLGLDKEFWQLPPSDAMLLHRKFGGLNLLSIRLKAPFRRSRQRPWHPPSAIHKSCLAVENAASLDPRGWRMRIGRTGPFSLAKPVIAPVDVAWAAPISIAT